MKKLIKKLLIKLILIKLNYSPTTKEIILIVDISIIK